MCYCSVAGGAALKKREAELDALQAELAEAKAKADARMAEADRMVDESMLAATKTLQEKKALNDEVRRVHGRAGGF